MADSKAIPGEVVQQACLAYGGGSFPGPMRRALEAVWPEPLFTEEEREVAHWAVELALSEVGHSRIAAGAVLRSASAKLERS